MDIGLAVKSVKDIIFHARTTGEVKAPKELKENRLSICKQCKFFNGKK